MSGLTSTDWGLPFRVKSNGHGKPSLQQTNILQTIRGLGEKSMETRFMWPAKSAGRIGNRRTRLPVAAKIAFAERPRAIGGHSGLAATARRAPVLGQNVNVDDRGSIGIRRTS